MKISTQLRSYRRSHDLSQDELAKQLGVSLSSIKAWEYEQTIPGPNAQLKITALIGANGFTPAEDLNQEPATLKPEIPAPRFKIVKGYLLIDSKTGTTKLIETMDE